MLSLIQSIPTTFRQGDQFYGKRNLSPERTHHVSRVAQPANGRAGTWVQASFCATTLSYNSLQGLPFPFRLVFRVLQDSVRSLLHSQTTEGPPRTKPPMVSAGPRGRQWAPRGGPKILCLELTPAGSRTGGGPQRGLDSSFPATSPCPCFTRPLS